MSVCESGHSSIFAGPELFGNFFFSMNFCCFLQAPGESLNEKPGIRLGSQKKGGKGGG